MYYALTYNFSGGCAFQIVMKACFLHQRSFTYVTHALAVALKKKYGVTDFCAYVYTRPAYNFLKSQKDINYSALLFDEELHNNYKSAELDYDFLKQIEKDYGLPNLWPYICVDRIVRFNQLVREYPYNTPKYSHEEMLKILQVKTKAVLEFLEKEKPDFIFIRFMGAVGSLLLYHVAKKKGIRVLTLMPFGIKNAHILSEEHKRFPEVEKAFARNVASPDKNNPYFAKAEKFLRDFRVKPAVYYETATPERQQIARPKQLKFLMPGNLYKSLKFLSKLLLQRFAGESAEDYSFIRPSEWLIDRAKRKIRGLIGYDDLYDKIDAKENFAFFPMHSEPDVSILLQSPFMDNQIYLADKIARSLPAGFKLYVKDHPTMANYRPRSYYKELKKIPNVKFINPRVTSFELSKMSKIVITIISTAAWEAMLLKKPVITCGDVFYNKLSFVKNCRALEDLPNLVKTQLENFNYSEAELLNFLAAMFEETAEFELYRYWGQESSFEEILAGIDPLADLLAKKLHLQKIG
ncbi:hypothetical protein A2926_01985 [Candidatus Giovannonibacteria bacterium RIFCSPLOWO2_01_FULL_44_40]|uniref:Capsule polysaccharide biosynthesis protein n=1 Tax=Candidatus Giovannonibacteria bacterium RIFCSPHIGHO2_01_FULL_45_23 TaxID=1798325 RepID=A0A1F5VG95_9BACT|nr:MAG: hypothetical protein A2834_03355 [Candidatus Giovannonibacteria bacterium RIFCSPHIGHO2_01_FULL_45_23]OGF76926.1 MAG: hypothetical protein A3C77_04845 [Candidatus Giovannonibacteria bacterium RIFCSPHIGHO2_02_FULL_45_13]OGF80297.1 MAG: hypothetical protein A2926_01985 [Candidatus Giovannonibacteria bacterium RIFCSPLOWO2_01_FULL_44_40]